MKVGTRIAKTCWFRSPLLTLSYSFLKFSTCSSAKVSSQCLDGDCGDFLPWLERKAGVEVSSVLSIGKSAYGRSLFAHASIQTGDCILKVPFNAQLAPDDLIPEINSLLSDGVGNIAKLAIVILYERKMGHQSEWAHYISHLPRHWEMHGTIFWSKEELEMIRQSSVFEETIKRNSHIEKEFFAVKPALDHLPEIFEDVTLKDFRHAYALVESRAWISTKGVSLIPFADFLNHSGGSEAVVSSDEANELSEVVADRNYSPGDEVLIRYGKFSNASLLLDFGFTLPHNIYDEVQIQVNIPHHDPLCARKLELLYGHCTPTCKDIDGFRSFWDSFTIKEVRSTQGTGRGIPQPLRAFARVLCSTSSEELDDLAIEAAQNDGRLARRPLPNKSSEIQAHQFLLSHITQIIEEYISSVKSIGPPDSSFKAEKLAVRRQMARDLLIGELRVLKSASEWLKNYCASLLASQNKQSAHST